MDHLFRLTSAIFFFCASLPILLYCHGSSGGLKLDIARWYGRPLCGRTDAAGESLVSRCSFCRFHVLCPIDRPLISNASRTHVFQSHVLEFLPQIGSHIRMIKHYPRLEVSFRDPSQELVVSRKGCDQFSIGYQSRTKWAFADHAFSCSTGQIRMTHEGMSKIIPRCNMYRSRSILEDSWCDQFQNPLTLNGSLHLSYQTMSYQHQLSHSESIGTS